MSLPKLLLCTQCLASQAFRPGTATNHSHQACVFINFCDHYQCPFLLPSISTVSMYITHLTRWFQSSCSVRNYVSGIRVLHRQLGLSPMALDSFQVQSLLRAADISMRTPPLRCLPILPDILHHLCLLTPSLGPLGPSMRVCLIFGFLAMLRQSNLAPPSPSAFDPPRHTCRGDIVQAPPGL